MMGFLQRFRFVFFVVLMLAVAWFFYAQIHSHWQQLSVSRVQLHWLWLIFGLFLVLIHYMMTTAAWRIAMVGGTETELSFAESIGISNVTQLTKYVPGKVWSYAIQMHLLASHGISKTRVVSTNLLMLLSLLSSATVLGSGYLVYSATVFPTVFSRALLVASVVGYICLIVGGTHAINATVRLLNRLFKRNIEPISIATSVILRVHGVNFASNVVYGLAGYVVAIGSGAPTTVDILVPIASATLLADTIGLLAIVAPGGIGVREGIMYVMLKSVLSAQICFVLLAAFRLVTAACDLMLGSTALLLLRWFSRRRASHLRG